MIGWLLGYRLAKRSRGRGRVRQFLTVFAVAVGILLILACLAAPNVIRDRQERVSGRAALLKDGSVSQFAGLAIPDRWHGDSLTRVLVPSGTVGPPPPGVARLPKPGEVVVSPALNKLANQSNTKALRDRLPGRVIGTIASAGLEQPQELLAYVGVTVAPWEGEVTGYGSSGRAGTAAVARRNGEQTANADQTAPKGHTAIWALGLLLLAPFTIFIAAVTRLGSANRDRRLVALTLLGLSSREVKIAAGVEASIPAVFGSVLGIAAFFLARPLSTHMTLAGVGWFTSDVRVAPAVVAATAAVVSAAAFFVGFASARALALPETSNRPTLAARNLSKFRLAPLAIGAAMLLAVAALPRDTSDRAPLLLVVGAGLLLAAAGIALAAPLTTRTLAVRLARRSRGPATLLAARSTHHEPMTAARMASVAVLLVFMTGVGQAILLAYHNDHTVGASEPYYNSRNLLVAISPHQQPLATNVLSDLHGVHNVASVALLGTPAAAANQSDAAYGRALVATCHDLAMLDPELRTSCVADRAYRLETADGNPPSLPVGSTVQLASFDPSRQQVIDYTVPQDTLAVSGSRFLDELQVNLLIPPTDSHLAALSPLEVEEHLVETDGTERTEQQVRAAVARASSATVVRDAEDRHLSDANTAAYSAGFYAAVLLALITVLCGLLVLGIDQIVHRTRSRSVLSALGAKKSTLAAAQVLSLVATFSCGAILAIAVSGLGGQAFLVLNDTPGRPSLFFPATAAFVSIVALALLILVAAPALATRADLDEIRQA
jgi:hypothetical protein